MALAVDRRRSPPAGDGVGRRAHVGRGSRSSARWGAVARFRVDGVVFVADALQSSFGTLVVNLTGTFTLGVVFGAPRSPTTCCSWPARAFFGGYTTFSTWMVESERLTEGGGSGPDGREPVAVARSSASPSPRWGGAGSGGAWHDDGRPQARRVLRGVAAHRRPTGRGRARRVLRPASARGRRALPRDRGLGLAGRRIHTERFADVSIDLPLVAEAIDTRERIEGVLADLDAILDRGLVTSSTRASAVGDDVRGADFPVGVGAAARLTVYCGRGESSGGRRGLPSRRRRAAAEGPAAPGAARRGRSLSTACAGAPPGC